MESRFYLCRKCGNLIGMVHSSGAEVYCCGEPMQQLKANTTDAAVEKHVPVVEVKGNSVSVRVGSATHPMTEEHFIQWIYLQTEQGAQRKNLTPGSAPEAVFELAGGDKLVAVMAYCNLHGLWAAEL